MLVKLLDVKLYANVKQISRTEVGNGQMQYKMCPFLMTCSIYKVLMNHVTAYVPNF